MIIKSMTATFGRLENETLEFHQGLNLISAPNEWGKSTWCAFLLAMLYGIDTAQRASRGVLPDKERYKSWSGRPMEGRMDLMWQGRAITIQRTTKGRVPMGEFRAYETESGENVPELTKDNCGLQLLGVERSVYQRSGFIRQADLPVTQDEALSRRLNALVTTGSENTAGFQLEKQLRDLQNRCRHNKTGLLPQVEAQLFALQGNLSQQESLLREEAKTESRLADLRSAEKSLLRHEKFLADQEAAEKRRALEEARAEEAQAKAQAAELSAYCKALPERGEADQALRALRALTKELSAWNVDAALLPPPAEPPRAPAALAGAAGTPKETAEEDLARYRALETKKKGNFLPFLVLSLLLLAGGAALAFALAAFGSLIQAIGIAAMAAGAGVLAFGLLSAGKKKKAYAAAQEEMGKILLGYGVSAAEEILPTADRYAAALEAYGEESARQAESRRNLAEDRARLLEKSARLSAPYDSPEAALGYWEEVAAAWDRWGDAQRSCRLAREHREALERLAGDLPAGEPDPADDLGLSFQETRDALLENRRKQERLQSQLDQSRGRRAVLGDPAGLSAQIDALQDRIGQLEDYYSALGYAQAALKTATGELRKRFAPRITGAARDILRELTAGRYDKLLLEEDLSLSAGTAEETALTSALRRSDGTVDQMYLALRLAVCGELLGEAPIVLDDALTRFDDTRLASALKLLRREAESRQILLFSCQSREKRILSQEA